MYVYTFTERDAFPNAFVSGAYLQWFAGLVSEGGRALVLRKPLQLFLAPRVRGVLNTEAYSFCVSLKLQFAVQESLTKTMRCAVNEWVHLNCARFTGVRSARST